MANIDPRAFEYSLQKITDGNIFERFAQDLLCQVLGYTFIPIGGIKDRGIDGLDRCSELDTIPDTIYQISIELDAESKIRKTLNTLKKNNVGCKRFYYVTNQTIKNQDILADSLYMDFGVSADFRDLAWLRGHVNHNEGTVRTYLTFVETYCHQFTASSQTLSVDDLNSDPRIFVFLRQQWQDRNEKIRLDQFLAETLILYALEGTDPDKGLLRTKDEILKRASQHVKFSLSLLEPTINERLSLLSKKPNRKINYHTKEDAYCLPYETRLDVEQKNLLDASLQDAFMKGAESRLKANLYLGSVQVKDSVTLLTSTFNNLFKQQGLEFANFIVESDPVDTIEKSLPDIIARVVDESSVIPKNRQPVKQALLGTVREIIYKGTNEEMEYLHRLSSSYMMLFLLQCDPKIAVYFSTMAGKLKVIVGNSIIVPAMSEWPLPSQHRRHWNLLKKAHAAGVKLFIDIGTLQELSSHISYVDQTYRTSYQGREAVFEDELAIMYVDEILIRSYLYSRIDNNITSFSEYLDQFASVDSPDPERDLLIWLKGTFGIELLDEEAIKIDNDELEKLVNELSKYKNSTKKAHNDAKTILNVFGLRKMQNEISTETIFGYRTWWLSKDTTTQRAVSACLGKKYATSAYMRADFLNNYIALSPNVEEINRAFDAMFPTLVGVSISHHIPSEISKAVQRGIQDHASKNPARVSAVIANLSDQLKTDLEANSTEKLTHYLDAHFTELAKSIE